MKTFAELKRNLGRDTSGMPPARLAVLADSATQLLKQALRGEAIERGIAMDVHEAPFAQIDAQVFDPRSDLYAFAPEYILIWQSAEVLLARFQEMPVSERSLFADRELAHLNGLMDALTANGATRVLCLTFLELDDAVFGSFATKVPASWIYQLRRLNYLLMEMAASRPELFLVDLTMLGTEYGRLFVEDRRIAASTHLLFSVDFLPVIASRILDVVDAIRGRIRKVLVLDLDNTLWGGVIGDDGMERIEIGDFGLGSVFGEFQAWARSLQERGILLAVNSKNDPALAAEPFQSHPDMKLRLEDISVFMANWDDKPDNLRHIQSILEVGFDSMVFLDDNPAERAIVQLRLPEVCVPDLPDDPSEWLPALRRLNLFEAAAYTAQDGARTAQYQTESKRRATRTTFASDREFLESLEMVGTIEGFTPFNIPRVAQLTQRSNQFNLRTLRYDEAEIRRRATSHDHICMAISLADRFGSHGLISVVIAEKRPDGWLVDTWVMSCRVLKRDVERFVLNALCDAVQARAGRTIIGEYLPTAKNGLVKDHYASLGFAERDGRWYLDVAQFVPLTHAMHATREEPNA